ncbi:MAG: type 4b pilus protein PilO2 [Alphaproteobacteria bacterium]|nr:type 4b pilus protein PilO2 [Alphaproteobacteria bacterium]
MAEEEEEYSVEDFENSEENAVGEVDSAEEYTEEEYPTEEQAEDFGEEATSDESSEEGSENQEGNEENWGSTITVGDTTYAVGLFWMELQNLSDPYPEVQESASQIVENGDLFCVYRAATPQYGVGSSAEGHKKGMPAAAAAVAESFSDLPTSVAVFKVNSGWWFLVVRNDVILSEDDVLYKTEEEAKKAFMDMMSVPDWDRRICPAEWGVEGTQDIPIEKFLKSKSVKLISIYKSNVKKYAMIGGGALLALIMLTKMCSEPETPKVQRRLAPVRRQVQEVVEEEEFSFVETKPWEKIPVSSDFMNRCYAGIMHIKSMVIPGWEVGNVFCTPKGLSTSWTMKSGHLGFLRRGFEEYGTAGMDYVLSDSGTSAIVSVSLGDIQLKSEYPKYSVSESREYLVNIFQAINQKINLSEDVLNVTIPIPGKKADGSQNTINKAYKRLTFSFDSSIDMADWLSVFNEFPALELKKITYSIEKNMWSYEGQIYEPTK